MPQDRPRSFITLTDGVSMLCVYGTPSDVRSAMLEAREVGRYDGDGFVTLERAPIPGAVVHFFSSVLELPGPIDVRLSRIATIQSVPDL